MSTPHEMMRTRTLERDVEEWSCTQCGRRLLVRRPPAFEKTVLERGDEWATHVAGTGGLRTAAMEAHSADRARPPSQDLDWLAAHGIDWGPDSER